jgi:hypothetical protein
MTPQGGFVGTNEIARARYEAMTARREGYQTIAGSETITAFPEPVLKRPVIDTSGLPDSPETPPESHGKAPSSPPKPVLDREAEQAALDLHKSAMKTFFVESPSPPNPVLAPYDASEQIKLLTVFMVMLDGATKDGGRKRNSGAKQPWYIDETHEAAIFSHLNKWKHGEKADKDSGAHPLVHVAWRCLAIAYQEWYGKKAP